MNTHMCVPRLTLHLLQRRCLLGRHPYLQLLCGAPGLDPEFLGALTTQH